MIQFLFTRVEPPGVWGDRSEHAADIPPVEQTKNEGCFMRDRTMLESEDYIRGLVRRGVWSPGVYEVFHDGEKIGTVEVGT
jgi:hypothetical protein